MKKVKLSEKIRRQQQVRGPIRCFGPDGKEIDFNYKPKYRGYEVIDMDNNKK